MGFHRTRCVRRRFRELTSLGKQNTILNFDWPGFFLLEDFAASNEIVVGEVGELVCANEVRSSCRILVWNTRFHRAVAVTRDKQQEYISIQICKQNFQKKTFSFIRFTVTTLLIRSIVILSNGNNDAFSMYLTIRSPSVRIIGKTNSSIV